MSLLLSHRYIFPKVVLIPQGVSYLENWNEVVSYSELPLIRIPEMCILATLKSRKAFFYSTNLPLK